LSALLMLAAGVETFAAEIPWRSLRFQYLAQRKDLGELLRELAAGEDIAIEVADGVQGVVNGKFNLPPQSMLELLATSHGFLWYYDGSILHVTPSGSVRTEVVQLKLGNVDQLRSMLARLHLDDPRFPLQTESEGNTVVVSGPTRYVELVRQAADSLERSQNWRQPTEIRIFPLKYAWAADHELDSGGRDLKVLGVASVLRSMFATRAPDSTQPALTQLRQSSPLRPVNANGGDFNTPSAIKPSALDDTAQEVASGLPVVQADARINAVLIRDLPARLQQYDSLISALDVRPGMIEIEARIIEVSNDEAERIGIDWAANRTKNNTTQSIQYGSPNAALPTPSPSNYFPSAGVLTTVAASATLSFLARIQVLVQHGKAKISASPKVLTLNNLEARMDNVDQFFVRVSGTYAAELFNVSTGVNLHVTPLIVTEGTRQRIRLDVRIEDGRLTEQTVDQIPVVRKSEINTQAFIDDGEALLIAGYAVDEQTSTRAGVPGISKIPVVGALFRHHDESKSTMQRMFLLTPRIATE
jgi:type III secretion protein C